MPDVRKQLAMLYTDRMTVKRYASGKDEDGATRKELESVPEMQDIPCRISFQGRDEPRRSDDGNPTEVQPLLICAPDVPLRSGDFVTVTRPGRGGDIQQVYAGNIGRPNPYANSLQVQFLDEEPS